MLVAAALLGGVLISGWQAQNPVRGGGVTTDFIARYAAGETVADGESPYDPLAHHRRAAAHNPDVVPVFDAPPVFGAFRVLTILPLRVAAALLTAMSYLSVGVLAWYVTRRARVDGAGGDRSPRADLALWGLGALALLQVSPVRHVLALGQTDLIVLALVLLLGAWVPSLALLKPQTAGLTAAAIFGRAAGVSWPFSLRTIRWRSVLIAVATFAGMVAVSQILAGAAHWDDWLRRVRDRQEASELHWLVPVVSALGIAVVARGVYRARRAHRRIDWVCVSAGATSLLAVTGGWNPQWFLAVLIPLAAVLIPYLLGEVPLARAPALALLLVTAAVAGDGYARYSEADPTYHPEVPIVALGGLLFALWLLGYLRALPAGMLLVLNAAIAAYPLTEVERVPLAVAAGVGVLYVLLEVRPSGLLPAAARRGDPLGDGALR